MNSSIITEDELLKENKTKNDKAANNNRVEELKTNSGMLKGLVIQMLIINNFWKSIH